MLQEKWHCGENAPIGHKTTRTTLIDFQDKVLNVVLVVFLLLSLWIRYTCVVYCFEAFDEYDFGEGYVAECDGAVLEVAVGNIAVDDFVYQCGDVLLSIFSYLARRSLHAVGNH